MMMLAIFPLLIGSVASQSTLVGHFSANVRRPASASYRTAQNMRPASSPVNGESRARSPAYVKEDFHHVDASGGRVSEPPSVYAQGAISRRSMAMLFTAGVLGLPMVDPKQSLAASTDIKLATFGKDAEATGTKHIWSYLRGSPADPQKDGKLLFKGGLLEGANTKGLPPGTKEKFILGNIDGKGFPDVTSCEGIALTVKFINILSSPQINGFTGMLEGSKPLEIPEYKAFSMSIGKNGGKLGAFNFGYKAKFDAPLNDFGTVKIPFKDFTNSWDTVTGDPINTCKSSPDNCPDQKTLENLSRMAFFAEIPGSFKLEIQDVSAYGCAAPVAALATFDNAGGVSPLWFFAAASLGVLYLHIRWARGRPALSPRPLLG